MKKEGRRHNSVLPQLAVTCVIGTERSYQTFVQVDNEVLRNRQLRQHANRCEVIVKNDTIETNDKKIYK